MGRDVVPVRIVSSISRIFINIFGAN
jgi:hypothetical protein